MFWLVFFIPIVSIIFIRVIILNKTIAYEDEVAVNNSIVEVIIDNVVIVVDKMIIFTQTKKNKYVLFIQLKSRKILEVNVSQEVFNSVNAGDYGMIEELNKGIYGFEKVS